VCVIAKKIRNRRPIRLDEINSHWKKLTIEFGNFEDDADEEVEDDYACTAEFEAIKVCFLIFYAMLFNILICR
jgi:hypothetical protein